MDLRPSPDERAFRDELRAWLAANPSEPMPRGDQASFEARRAWQRRMYEAGWVGIHWPVEYGGRGATRIEQAIFTEEMGRARAPRFANTIAIEMGGPTLIDHGTEAHKQRHLQPILSGEEIWCQAFSEPGAGSDLAALSTRATKVDGGWSVSGQKVWTSLAREARWCMLLTRSDPEQKAHRGMTYFILDMQAPGIEIRPIVQLTGETEFNELFLQDVFIPDENVLGEVGGGWRVAITTLMNERAGLGLAAQVDTRVALDELSEQAAREGWDSDPVVADKLADLHVQAQALRLTTYRGLSDIDRAGGPGPKGTLPKWQWAQLNQAVSELAVELIGTDGIDPDDPWTYRFLRSRANSIEGGTTEVLRNIVAERVLGLPRAR